MKRATNETFRNFESRFPAQTSRFNSESGSSKIPEALPAFILLANSAVDNSQRKFVIARASNGTVLESSATTDEFLVTVLYRKEALLLRQWDEVRSDANPLLNVNVINAQVMKQYTSLIDRTRS